MFFVCMSSTKNLSLYLHVNQEHISQLPFPKSEKLPPINLVHVSKNEKMPSNHIKTKTILLKYEQSS